MKTKPNIFDMIASAEVCGVDQNAFTSAELRESDPHKRKKTWWKEVVAKKVKTGEWERVHKRVNGILIPAYRPSQKPR